MARAKFTAEVSSPSLGYVSATDCEQIGVASLLLGGGRLRQDDAVDHAVGIVMHKKIGDAVQAGESLCTLHYNAVERVELVREMLQANIKIATEPPASRTQIVRRVLRNE